MILPVYEGFDVTRIQAILTHCRSVIAKARLRGIDTAADKTVAAALHVFKSGNSELEQLRRLTKRLNK